MVTAHLPPVPVGDEPTIRGPPISEERGVNTMTRYRTLLAVPGIAVLGMLLNVRAQSGADVPASTDSEPVAVQTSDVAAEVAAEQQRPKTQVSIRGEMFYLNGKPTYEGATWKGHKIEGLLMNSRMVQGIFDDLNPETVSRWAYPDTGKWDPERNTNEFVAAMPEWRRHGVLCAVVNLQGGSPMGYGNHGWHNSAITSNGDLRPDYMGRLERIIDRADELGMVIMVGIFYFGQDQHLDNENAVRQAVINTVDWIADRGYANVLVEIANEYPASQYEHEIIRERPEELIRLAQRRAAERGLSLPVSVSSFALRVPSQAVVDASDYILLHGNAIKDPAEMVKKIQTLRSMAGDTPKPIVNNEDDSPWSPRRLAPGQQPPGWETEGITNNFMACVKNYVSWGYFDWRQRDEGFDEGFQSVPVNWQISSERKRTFFNLVEEITGGAGDPEVREGGPD
jgi:hypothetical protein